ncbi:MAG: hypothetical protein IPM34_10050 [Saprospiraceae bacterium]|nr:hypothetical protein [Saprospiraceae bacterium]
MKHKFYFFASLLLVSFAFNACKDDDLVPSTSQEISLPFIAEKLMSDSYVYGVGQATLEKDLPEVVAVAVDTVYGMVGGYGGKTGSDSVNILKSENLGIPDLSEIGGYSIAFEKFNKGGYKVSTSANIVIAGPIANPGPTAMEGTYRRTANGHLQDIIKVFDGVYIIGQPGGAAVTFVPYLLYNYKNQSGGDSLAFPVQTDGCGGGLRLVAPAAPVSKTAGEYDAFPPEIASLSPITFRWKVFEFPSANNSALHPDGALCAWGHTAIRVFEKQ